MSSSRSLKEEKPKKKRRRDVFAEEDDGSQAWCIVMSCFVVNVIIMGFLKCLGILIIELMKAFSATPADVSILVSITLCLNCVAGPLACYLAVICSARTVAFVGTSMVSFGLMISYFARSMTYLYISLGVFAGFGSGLTYSPGMILIGNYFQKNRGMANGVIVSGSPVGGMIMPYVFNFLVRYLGIRGALLVLGGLMMNTVVCTLSYRPYRKSAKVFGTSQNQTDDEDPANLRRTSGSACISACQDASTCVRRSQTAYDSDDSSGPEFVDYSLSRQRVVQSRSGTASTGSSVVVYKINERYGEKSHVRKANKDPSEEPTKPPMWHTSDQNGMQSSLSKGPTNKGEMNFSTTDVVQGQQIQPKESQTEIHTSNVAMHPFTSRIKRNSGSLRPGIFNSHHEATSGRLIGSPPISKDFRMSQSSRFGSSHTGTGLRHRKPRHDLPNKRKELHSTSTKKLSPYILSLDHSCVIMWSNDDLTKGKDPDGLTSSKAAILRASWSDDDQFDTRAKDSGAMGDNPSTHASDTSSHSDLQNQSCCSKAINWIRNSPLNNCSFLILLMSNSATAIATTNILLLIPALGEYRGLSKAQYSTVYLIISVCDMVARLTGSFISDKGIVTPKAIFAGGLFFAGISSTFIAFMHSFWSLSVASGVFGFASGLHIGIYGTLLADILGVELLHVGYALSMIVNGILQFSFIYISGQILSSNRGAFTPLYVFYGMCLVLGSSLWLLPLFNWAKHKLHFRNRQPPLLPEDAAEDAEDFSRETNLPETPKHITSSPAKQNKPNNSSNTAGVMSNVSLY